MKDETKTFISLQITIDDLAMIERMMRDDFEENRSAFIRKLIRKEWDRRFKWVNAGDIIKGE